LEICFLTIKLVNRLRTGGAKKKKRSKLVEQMTKKKKILSILKRNQKQNTTTKSKKESITSKSQPGQSNDDWDYFREIRNKINVTPTRKANIKQAGLTSTTQATKALLSSGPEYTLWSTEVIFGLLSNLACYRCPKKLVVVATKYEGFYCEISLYCKECKRGYLIANRN
jgi:hypothetical protein